MAHRTKEGQKVHDQKVAEIARRLENQGYRVQADLPSHPKPRSIGGYVPDVLATRRGRTLIREVETHGTVSKDWKQHEAFREYAEKRDNTNFRILLAKKK